MYYNKYLYSDAGITCQHDKWNKGVSIVHIANEYLTHCIRSSYHHNIPYTLKFIISYSITSNSKAA